MTPAQARALGASRLVSVVVTEGGEAVITPNGRVGAVRVGDLQVEVWPKEKVKLAHLLFMLGYAADPGFRPEAIDAEAYDELWPALAESLARLVERALLGGVLQGYRTIEESSNVVRGRVRVADQLRRHPGRIYPTEIAYDEYLTDIAENQILRTALRRMRSVPRLRRDVVARLTHLDNRLDGVAVLRRGVPSPAWRATRLNARYVPALRLSELVLRNAAARAGDDGVEIAAFVVVMWKVFEDFVTVALKEEIAHQGRRSVAQQRWWLDAERTDLIPRVPMAIDLIEYDGGAPHVIYDAKYKASGGEGRYPNADFYQMLAYCTTTGLDRAILVYAQGGSPVDRWVENSAVRIREWPLDLSLTPEQMLASIHEAVATASIPLSAGNKKVAQGVSA
ncbi:McrC family protein [Rathayibacter sp. AY1A4]|nr:restriction endonuclease [Rathayibacter sp. AY1A4]